MKVPAIVAVMVLGAASMMAQAAASSGTAATAPDASKPAEHAACKHEMAKSGTKKMCHCMRNKKGSMAKEMDGSKHGSCPRMKKEAEDKS
jgi:hypothetical protein